MPEQLCSSAPAWTHPLLSQLIVCTLLNPLPSNAGGRLRLDDGLPLLVVVYICIPAHHHHHRLTNPLHAPGRYTVAEVRAQDGTDGKPVWVTYNGSVHDVTSFIAEHPGGSLITQAAGGAVEPFWSVWAYHFLSSKVVTALDATRIGTVAPTTVHDDLAAPYAAEPVRAEEDHRVLIRRPFCTETPERVLMRAPLTDAKALYIRNHAPVPLITNADDHEVTFYSDIAAGAEPNASVGAGADEDTRELDTLTVAALLARFEHVEVTSVLQCAGNRTSDDMRATGKEGNGFVRTCFYGGPSHVHRSRLGCGGGLHVLCIDPA